MANASTSSGQPLTLLQAVRGAIRHKHYSYRTEKCYLFWVRQFLRYHGRRHPRLMGAAEVTAFLNSLALSRRVAAGTQNQALAAILLGGEISQGRPPVGLAVHLSVGGDVHRSVHRCNGSLPPSSANDSARRTRGGDARGHHEAGWLPHLASLFRNASTGAWLRHPHHPRAPRPQGRGDDDDLYACSQPSGTRGVESP
jgi:hypothetical protein